MTDPYAVDGSCGSVELSFGKPSTASSQKNAKFDVYLGLGIGGAVVMYGSTIAHIMCISIDLNLSD